MISIELDGGNPFTLDFPISAKHLEVSRRFLSQVTEQLDLEINENMPLRINREKLGKLAGFAFCGQFFQRVLAALVLSFSGLCLDQRIDHAAQVAHQGALVAHFFHPGTPAGLANFKAANQAEQRLACRVHEGAFGSQAPSQAAFGISSQLVKFALGDGIQNFFACFPGPLVFWATRCSFSHEVLLGRFPSGGLAKTFWRRFGEIRSTPLMMGELPIFRPVGNWRHGHSPMKLRYEIIEKISKQAPDLPLDHRPVDGYSDSFKIPGGCSQAWLGGCDGAKGQVFPSRGDPYLRHGRLIYGCRRAAAAKNTDNCGKLVPAAKWHSNR